MTRLIRSSGKAKRKPKASAATPTGSHPRTVPPVQVNPAYTEWAARNPDQAALVKDSVIGTQSQTRKIEKRRATVNARMK